MRKCERINEFVLLVALFVPDVELVVWLQLLELIF